MNILFTSVGRRSYLVRYFKNALKDKGEIHVINSDIHSPAFQFADKATVSPLIYSQDYIPFLMQYCRDNSIRAIISLFDIDLPILSANKNILKKIGVNVIVADYQFVNICEDKWKTREFLAKYDILYPKTYLTLNSAQDAIISGEVHFPVIIKPRWGMGSIGLYEAKNNTELVVLYKKAKEDIIKSYLKYESNNDLEHSVIIQEKIEGQELGLDVINDLKGDYILTSVKKKISMRAGETDCAVTIEDSKAEKIGKYIATLSKHPANLDIDLIVNDSGYYVLEMNPRFGGGFPFSYIAGVDLPKAIIRWLLGENVNKKELTPQIGIMGQKDIEMVKI